MSQLLNPIIGSYGLDVIRVYNKHISSSHRNNCFRRTKETSDTHIWFVLCVSKLSGCFNRDKTTKSDWAMHRPTHTACVMM